ncbi:hypothetical protein Taro_022935 [Colocasia esculenta]|uniref:CCHC-type domain-containing protein n=1 Tax=Colocasia esculenta TaxID=4460 RepID=A0A843V9U8_COLES|nr:hypothetical protein [Colocasia esculenta]
MAASGSSGSVGGYSVAFLTADQQERYSAMKTKLCGNKAVDLADLEKHGMHGVVEALQRLKLAGICWKLEKSTSRDVDVDLFRHEVDGVIRCRQSLGEDLDGVVVAVRFFMVVRGRLSRFEELCLSVVGLVLLLHFFSYPFEFRLVVPVPTIIEESVVDQLAGAADIEGEHEETQNVPEEETTLKEIHEDTIAKVVAPGHTEDVQMEDAPAQGEPEIQGDPVIQRDLTVSAPANQFQEGVVESTSDEDVEPVIGSGVRDVSSIFISQSTGAKEIGAVKSELLEMRSELGSLKQLVTDLSDFVRVQLSAPAPPAPTQSVPEVSIGPSGSAELDAGPSGPFVEEPGPPGPSAEEVEPSGPSIKESGPCAVEESSSKKKHGNALKAAEDTSGDESDSDKSNGSSEDEEAFLSRRLQRILAKKKYQSGRRFFKKGQDLKRSEEKEVKKPEPICYECKKLGHIKAECAKLKKTEFKKKHNSKKFKRYKKKAMAAA